AGPRPAPPPPAAAPSRTDAPATATPCRTSALPGTRRSTAPGTAPAPGSPARPWPPPRGSGRWSCRCSPACPRRTRSGSRRRRCSEWRVASGEWRVSSCAALLQLGDEAGEHPADFVRPGQQGRELGLVEIVQTEGDLQLGLHLGQGAAGDEQEADEIRRAAPGA